ncbi:IclR family acetate operon transcriptional repressor [Arthrobacter pigmenti]|uniref:IclR family acetate operon transcriptional repressor n=1 Tax=Arthrobacter pigmenti TaxID=271432 RepID=A0A846RT48_9MICC|nr:IclR family acetate operon transcriptional repressor [Arthrobacter pigmenti]
MAPNDQSPMRSLERAFDVLGVLEQNIRPLRLTDIAQQAGLAISTTQRILNVLEGRGLVERDESTYQLGVGTVPMAHAFLRGNRLSAAALPVLQELATATGLTASLYVKSGKSRVVVARVEGEHPLRYALPIGERLPLHLGAGRVLASGMTDEEVDELLRAVEVVQMQSGVELTPEEFKDSLQAIRADGYLVAHSERAVDTTSVSAPVFSGSGRMVGVVVVSGSDAHMSGEKVTQVVWEVRQAARSIGQRHLSAPEPLQARNTMGR